MPFRFEMTPTRRHTLIALGVMLLLVLLYFKPALTGKVIPAGDDLKAKGMAQSINEFRAEYDAEPYWLPSMFSGMPAFMVHVRYLKWSFIQFLKPIFYNGAPFPVLILFWAMVFSFFLLRRFDVSVWMSLAGAIAYAFFTYHLILLEAGHNTKLMALGYAPAVLFAIRLAFTGRALWGGVMIALGMGFMVMSGHYQMVYYLLFVVLFYGAHELYNAWQSGRWRSFGLALGSLVVGVLFALGFHATKLLTAQEYATYSIRGPSELQTSPDKIARQGLQSQQAKQAAQQAAQGDETSDEALSKSYAFRWSNGRGELLTMLIPNLYGGPSRMGRDELRSFVQEHPNINFQQAYQAAGGVARYWGPQPFTSGPMYFGALLIFFFVAGLYLLNNPLKYALLYVSLLAMMLSLGKNSLLWYDALVIFLLPAAFAVLRERVKTSPWVLSTGLGLFGLFYVLVIAGAPESGYRLTDFFFDYVPLYNKFRAPASILTMAMMAMPWLAFLGGQKLLDAEIAPEHRRKALLYGGGLVGGLCVIFVLMPGAFLDFISPAERQKMMGGQNAALLQQLFNALADYRQGLAQADAARSLFYVLAGGGIAFAFLKGWLKSAPAAGILVVILVALDFLVVDSRFISWDDYVSKMQYDQQTGSRKPADRLLQGQIEPKDSHFRVYPMNRNPFNDGNTPYGLKTVGGYHAAKMRRYQQFADVHLLNPANKYRFHKNDSMAQRMLQQIPSRALTPLDITPAALKMLNMKYIIHQQAYARVPMRGIRLAKRAGQEAILRNERNLGPAWIVPNVKTLPRPDDVLREIYTLKPSQTALIEAGQADKLREHSSAPVAASEYVRLLSHNNRVMHYELNLKQPRFVVFSEVYYPHGWTAYLDCEQAVPVDNAFPDCPKTLPILQTNFILRGVVVPAGKHTLTMRFDPDVILRTGKSISLASSILFVLVVLGLGYWEYRTRRADASSG